MLTYRTSKTLFVSLLVSVALAACGGGGGDNDTTVRSFLVGGEVAGLASGQVVVLSNNGIESLTQSSNGAFVFKNPIESGKTYEVTVSTQPSSQSCTVTNGSGTASGAVSNIQVQCVDTGSAACFDSPQLRTTGNYYTVVTPQDTSQFYVQGPTNYHGYAAVETEIQSTSLPSPVTRAYSYSNVTDGMLLNYGSLGVVLRYYTKNEIYYQPGRGFPISLNPNQTYTTQVKQINVDYNLPDTSTTWQDTITYLGREPVTTAFGTFETCRLRYTTQGQDGVRKTWDSWLVGVGKLAGLQVQQTTETGTTQPTNITVSWD